MKSQRSKGYSIIEMLVVIFVFSLLAVVATQSVALVLKGTAKSENISEVRANVEYAMSVMERSLRNAQQLDSAFDCVVNHGTSYKAVGYLDENGIGQSFSCNDSNASDQHIVSSAYNSRLTNTNANLDCSVGVFTCPDDNTVLITLTASDPNNAGALGATVTERTTVSLRSKYSNQ